MASRTAQSPSPMDFFWAAPPVTRTLTALVLVISILVYTKLLSIYLVLFHTSYFLKFPPELWRLFSSFLLSGPQLGIIFDPYFLYTYGSKLESASPRFSNPVDFYFYLVFVWATILVLNLILTGGYIFTSALILAFTYTACQDDRLSRASFIIIQIPATWVPGAMLLLTLIMSGPQQAVIQGTGLIAAHLHDFLSNLYPTFGGGRNLIETPAFFERFFATTVPRVLHRAYGTAIRPATAPARGSSTSASTGASSAGVLPDSWKSRGSGRRLGGE